MRIFNLNLSLLVLLSSFNPANAGNDLKENGTEDAHTIDLASDRYIGLVQDYSGDFHVTVKNMVPTFSHRYSFTFEGTVKPITPFKRPESEKIRQKNLENIEAQESISKSKEGIAQKKICDEMNELIKAAYYATTSVQVRDKYNNYLDRKLNPNYKTYVNCKEVIDLEEKFYKAYQKTFILKVRPNSTNTFTVSFNENTLRSVSVEGESKEWVSHVGFSFVDNKDEEFFSIPTADGKFGLAQKAESDDFQYAATVLFTYPIGDKYSDYNHGVTTGFGTNSNSILVLAGYSLMVRENFIITGHITFQEFKELNGIYNSSTKTDSAVDSSLLEVEKYKPAFGITFGYKFGS